MMSVKPEDEFFIGSEREVPRVLRRFLYNRLIGIFAFVFSLALLIPFLQRRYEPSFHHSLSRYVIEGVLFAEPVPYLMVERPGNIPDEQFPFSSYLLVSPGKFGFPIKDYSELNGRLVQLRGSLIFNRNETIVEVDRKSLHPVGIDNGDGKNGPDLELVGSFNVVGEIVDSKHYFGALNPGYGKPIRASAVRSIANGVPPLLLLNDERGQKLELIVTGPDFEPIGSDVLDFVGVPVRINGDVYRWSTKFVIQTSKERIESLE